jgi:hypothetical protein
VLFSSSNYLKTIVIRWGFSCAEVNNKEVEHLQLKFLCFYFTFTVCGGVRGGAKPSKATERTTLQFPVCQYSCAATTWRCVYRACRQGCQDAHDPSTSLCVPRIRTCHLIRNELFSNFPVASTIMLLFST